VAADTEGSPQKDNKTMKRLLILATALALVGCGGGGGYYGGIPDLGSTIGSSYNQNIAPMMQQYQEQLMNNAYPPPGSWNNPIYYRPARSGTLGNWY